MTRQGIKVPLMVLRGALGGKKAGLCLVVIIGLGLELVLKVAALSTGIAKPTSGIGEGERNQPVPSGHHSISLYQSRIASFNLMASSSGRKLQ